MDSEPMKYVEFKNDVMFALTMQHKDLGKRFLERVLGRKIADAKLDNKERTDLSVEETVLVAIQRRSVRLDVLFEGENEWYNLELQVENEHNLPKRSRYNHSCMDVRSLPEGEDVGKLKKSYVIFVCCFDYFKMGKPKYFFEMYDAENALRLKDEQYTIILNTKAKNAPEGIKELFEYINNGTVTEGDSLIEDIAGFVDNMNEKGAGGLIMTMQEKYDAGVLAARKEGRKEGKSETILELVRDGLLTYKVAADKLGISEKELLGMI